MTTSSRFRSALLTAVAGAGILAGAPIARADGNLGNLNHIIIVMQENHSYDNYFGVLGYVAGSPYHNAHRRRGCDATDTTCVDGLRCKPSVGGLVCRNHNANTNAPSVRSFHEPRYCIGPDLDHSWVGSHEEANFKHPARTLRSSPNNGFVKVNNTANSPDTTQAVNHDTMGYFDDGDLPFYYDIAKTFAISAASRTFLSSTSPATSSASSVPTASAPARPTSSPTPPTPARTGSSPGPWSWPATPATCARCSSTAAARTRR